MIKFLHWRTDPLLLDHTQIVQNNWLTANELLEADQGEKFIQSNGQLHLYPIMVRKIDFISGERILQSFPYILLD